ncbi:tetratricopeptide repeat protein [Sinisalibacter lacisalsi]|uniref:tetratricopeptide repeat protein n=1 Tax=Sinisalibacter lacisalsi TaxID=1526570 RepID=UPI00166C088C|nr:tetratricopeptide repeat protein [Sinisalibacter lacisalsi]
MKTSARAWVIALCFPGAGLAQDTSVATAEPVPVLSAPAAEANGHDDPAPQLAATQSLTTTSEDPGDAPAPVVLSANDEAEAAAPGAGTAEPPAGKLADDMEGADAVRDDVATDPAPTLSPEAARCREIAGPADAGVPANAESAARRRAAIAEAAEACTAAARADDAPADVLFLAAEVAQARRDLPAAFTLLERAADAGLAAAVTRLGDYHLFGVAPGGEDTEAAIAHFQRAAGMGDPAGMTTLAMMYRVGKGVPRDPARMVDLLQTAADAGYHFAQYRLGQTLLTGEGIPNRADADLGIPDPVRGAALYTAAARAGNVTAALELAALYGDPASGLEDNPKARAQLTSLASRSGLPEAIAAMAVLYETGDGVEYDPDVAAQLYVRALESGKVAFETLRQGAPGGWDRETALAFQAILRERGLYTGALDGIVGSGTAAAARGLSPG